MESAIALQPLHHAHPVPMPDAHLSPIIIIPHCIHCIALLHAIVAVDSSSAELGASSESSELAPAYFVTNTFPGVLA